MVGCCFCIVSVGKDTKIIIKPALHTQIIYMFCLEFAPNSIIIVIFASRNTNNTSCFRKERKK